MKSPIPFPAIFRRSALAGRSAVLLLSAVSLFGLTALSPAAVREGATPKDWPASAEKHQAKITREAADAKQSALIAAAEAAQPTKESLKLAAGGGEVPAGDKVWWYKEELGIRIPCAITGDAVAYYAELIAKYGKQAFNRYAEPTSRLEYHAAVVFHKEFKQGEQTFADVHVVTLKLSFSQTFAATQTEGMSFQKERVVVIDAAGKVLSIAGDGPTEVPVLAI